MNVLLKFGSKRSKSENHEFTTKMSKCDTKHQQYETADHMWHETQIMSVNDHSESQLSVFQAALCTGPPRFLIRAWSLYLQVKNFKKSTDKNNTHTSKSRVDLSFTRENTAMQKQNNNRKRLHQQSTILETCECEVWQRKLRKFSKGHYSSCKSRRHSEPVFLVRWVRLHRLTICFRRTALLWSIFTGPVKTDNHAPE